jgi:MYXO-CTERM domain-containing protein
VPALLPWPQAHAAILEANRVIDWGKAGVKGGIPVRPVGRNCKIDDGAVGDGVSDDTGKIKACLAATPTGTAAYLPPGTYRLTGSISIPASKTLRGAGVSRTAGTVILNTGSTAYLTGILRMTTSLPFTGSPYPCPSASQAIAVQGSPKKGASTLAVASVSGLAVGHVIVVSRLNGGAGAFDYGTTIMPTSCGYCGICGGTRAMTQLTEIQAIDGPTLTITIDPPLVHDFDAAYSPQVASLGPMLGSSGVEDLVVNDQSPASARAEMPFELSYVKDCWLKNVETQNGYKKHVMILGGLRNTVHDSFFWTESLAKADNGIPDRNYGVSLNNVSSFNLIQSNRLDNVLVGVAMDGGPGAGNVSAYNYVNRQLYCGSGTCDSDYLQASLASHSAHTTYNLYEGNQIRKFMADYIHGSSSHTLLFRNQLIGNQGYGLPTPNEQGSVKSWGLWLILIEGYNDIYSVVGNVLGFPGYEGVYEFTNSTTSCGTGDPDPGSIYKIGYTNAFNCSGTEPLAYTTLFRHGNYDYVGGATKWDPANPDHTLPPSMYLTGKPWWWCNETPWPPIGPDLSPMVSDIPAKRRYDGNACTAPSGVICGGVICPPGWSCAASLCIGPQSDAGVRDIPPFPTDLGTKDLGAGVWDMPPSPTDLGTKDLGAGDRGSDTVKPGDAADKRDRSAVRNDLAATDTGRGRDGAVRSDAGGATRLSGGCGCALADTESGALAPLLVALGGAAVRGRRRHSIPDHVGRG